MLTPKETFATIASNALDSQMGELDGMAIKREDAKEPRHAKSRRSVFRIRATVCNSGQPHNRAWSLEKERSDVRSSASRPRLMTVIACIATEAEKTYIL